MYEKVLYPTDFSEASRKALPYLLGLKGAGLKEVVLLHVVDRREIDLLAPYSPYLEKDPVKMMFQRAEEDARAMATELEEGGVTVKVRLEEGVPFEEILRVEEEEDVSLVILGSHGKSAIERMLLGSVSEKVVRKSKRPVLIVR